MGRGRARSGGFAVFATALAALAIAGCGAQSHPNEPRPQPPTRVSVTISDDQVLVQPGEIGFGKEKSQQIPQNQNHPQPPIKGDERPLDVIFVTANQTTADAHLRLRGPRVESSETVFANSPATFQAELPAGEYTITAAGIPGAEPGKLVVGRVRTSSENDVLLP
jgi:hypothetical protein